MTRTDDVALDEALDPLVLARPVEDCAAWMTSRSR
jgi:hypothetical protein